MKPTQKGLVIGLAGVLAWVVFLLTTGPIVGVGELAPPRLEAIKQPARADEPWTLLDLDDKPVDFARFRGRPIVLNIWATWCGPCLKEMPSIAHLAQNQRLKERGFVFLCVSIDASADDLRDYMKGKAYEVTVLRATSLPKAFTTDGIPATYVIAADGQIMVAEEGAAQWDAPAVVDYLEKIGKPPG